MLRIIPQTDKLVCIPYFVLGEPYPDNDQTLESIAHFVLTPGVINADEVIVQSEAMKQAYVKILLKQYGDTDENKYISDGWGIYDNTADLDRAIVLSDGYYGDYSSVVQLCQKRKMPIMIQNVEVQKLFNLMMDNPIMILDGDI